MPSKLTMLMVALFICIRYANQKLITTVHVAVGGCTFCRFAYEGNFNVCMSKTSERHRAQKSQAVLPYPDLLRGQFLCMPSQIDTIFFICYPFKMQSNVVIHTQKHHVCRVGWRNSNIFFSNALLDISYKCAHQQILKQTE